MNGDRDMLELAINIVATAALLSTACAMAVTFYNHLKR